MPKGDESPLGQASLILHLPLPKAVSTYPDSISFGCVQSELDKTSEVSKVLYPAAFEAIWDRVLPSRRLAEDFRSLTSTEIEHTHFINPSRQA